MAEVSKADVYLFWANAINNAYFEGRGMREKFYVIEPEPGKKSVLKQLPNRVVTFVDPQAVVNALLFLAVEAGSEGYPITHSGAIEAVKFWMAITNPIKMPQYLGERHSPDLCFHRLDFNYSDEPGETLVLDEFISRCSNADAVKMFIGSLTIENSSRFQYLWIYGSGGEGKGSFGRALIRTFGPGCITMPVPNTSSQKQFLAYSLQGKRLCIFPECSNFNFPSDPLFKQLTGNDHVWLEQKGKMGFSAAINAKFAFFSNERPGIQGTDANMRRIIYSEIGKPTATYAPGTYDALLASEMGAFVLKCRKLYLEKCPNDENIPFEDEKTKELIDLNEEQYQVLTEKWLTVGAEKTITPNEFRDIQRMAGLNNFEYRQWIEYLRSKVGIKSVSRRWCAGGATSRRWIGVAMTPELSRPIDTWASHHDEI